MARVKGIKEVAEASRSIVQRNPKTWMPIYFDIKRNRVIAEAEYDRMENTDDCFMLTSLIRPCTEEEVEQTVNRFRWM